MNQYQAYLQTFARSVAGCAPSVDVEVAAAVALGMKHGRIFVNTAQGHACVFPLSLSSLDAAVAGLVR